mmetsp:Transcript_32399/g.49029  ORF Transcript_32399/g.49029 Transcript_32399/m.49029 type:complete len:380 (+) Transcript_32399:81-1220(+)
MIHTDSIVPNSNCETDSTSNSAISDTSALFSRLSINNQAISQNSESGGDENSCEDGKCDLVHAGPSSTIYRIEDPDNKRLGGRTGYVALKTHVDQFPTEEQIHRLENEYNISSHLLNCAVARNPLRQTLNDGVKMLFLEWVDGFPLRKYLLAADHNPRQMMGIARTVVSAIGDIHDAGAAHNNITLDNIIVDEKNKAIQIIDFASASLLDKSDKLVSGSVRKDLMCLGVILFEVFSGQSLFQKDQTNQDVVMTFFDIFQANEEKGVKKNLPLPNAIYSKLCPKVPVILLKLILNLMEVQGTIKRYHSARDVEKDLIDFGDPDAFFSNSKTDASFGQLDVRPDRLYDQAHNISLLTSVCNRIVSSNPPELVLIAGCENMG